MQHVLGDGPTPVRLLRPVTVPGVEASVQVDAVVGIRDEVEVPCEHGQGDRRLQSTADADDKLLPLLPQSRISFMQILLPRVPVEPLASAGREVGHKEVKDPGSSSQAQAG